MKRNRNLLAGLMLALLVLTPLSAAFGAEQQDVTKSVTTGSQTFSLAVGKRTAQFVRINLNDTRLEIRPVLAHQELGKTESLESMAKRQGAVAAINGTFFMAYNEGAHKPPWGKIVIDFHSIQDGSSGASIGFNGNIKPVIDSSKNLNADSFQHISSAGPTLLKDGKIVVDPLAEGMTDPKLTTLSGQRSFIGYTADNQIIMGTVPNVTLAQLAEICKSMGLVAAMNLDGGASSGLYAHGKNLTRPGRELSNALVVVTKKTAPPIQVTSQGTSLVFSHGPLLIKGSLYVPASEFLEKVGAKVTLQAQEKLLTATYADREIQLAENGALRKMNGGISSYLPTRFIAGKQMVPLRAIAESLGLGVEWDPQTSVAKIVNAEAPKEEETKTGLE